jgi:hypothetical protein
VIEYMLDYKWRTFGRAHFTLMAAIAVALAIVLTASNYYYQVRYARRYKKLLHV